MIEHHVVAGSVIRRIHHTNTLFLLVAVLVLLVLFVMQRVWLSHAALWSMLVVLVVVLLASAFTGRLLPDDVYSSVSRAIVGHELSEAPFGSILTSILGLNASQVARLSMPYAIHALFLPMVLSVGICLLWRRIGQPSIISVVGAAVVIALSAALPVTHYAVRDVLRDANAYSVMEPWYPFIVPNTLVNWFGAELAGYVSLAAFSVLVTLPLWVRRSR